MPSFSYKFLCIAFAAVVVLVYQFVVISNPEKSWASSNYMSNRRTLNSVVAGQEGVSNSGVKRLSLFSNLYSLSSRKSNDGLHGLVPGTSASNHLAYAKTSKYNFKIFVYDLPLWANSLIHKRNPWCSNGVFSSEIYIHKQLLENTHGVRTFDPEEADFFFVPVYATCLVYRSFSQFPKYRFLVEEVLKYIINEFPYWKRKYAADAALSLLHYLPLNPCFGSTNLFHFVYFRDARARPHMAICP